MLVAGEAQGQMIRERRESVQSEVVKIVDERRNGLFRLQK
jgi:hypothetical protein